MYIYICMYVCIYTDILSQVNRANDVTPEGHPGPCHTYKTKSFRATIWRYSPVKCFCGTANPRCVIDR